MWFSVGQLYSSQKLLSWIAAGPVRPTDIKGSDITTVFVCPAEDVLNVVLLGVWVSVNTDGILQLTERGKHLLALEPPTICLREQLRDLIAIDKPAWSKLIGRGRYELTRTAPPEVNQMLTEAGLLTKPPDDNIVSWWDEMSELARGFRAADLLEVGRTGERLTLQHEMRRTNQEPIWQAIESNLSGFDVLSIVTETDRTPLRIEVKASARNINAADFTLTRNEWETACLSGNYVFHLWQVADKVKPRLAVIDFANLRAHVPNDSGVGKWQQVRVPFSAFRSGFAQT